MYDCFDVQGWKINYKREVPPLRVGLWVPPFYSLLVLIGTWIGIGLADISCFGIVNQHIDCSIILKLTINTIIPGRKPGVTIQ